MTLVSVRLFAALRELAGSSRVDAQGATVGEVIDGLSTRYGPRFEAVARSSSAIVDGERAETSTALSDGQEVALLPPVSGGLSVSVPALRY